jgi:hypothetical protein
MSSSYTFSSGSLIFTLGLEVERRKGTVSELPQERQYREVRFHHTADCAVSWGFAWCLYSPFLDGCVRSMLESKIMIFRRHGPW